MTPGERETGCMQHAILLLQAGPTTLTAGTACVQEQPSCAAAARAWHHHILPFAPLRPGGHLHVRAAARLLELRLGMRMTHHAHQ